MQRLRGSDSYAIYSESPSSPFITLKIAIYSPTAGNSLPGIDDLRSYVRRGIEVTGATRANLAIRRVPLDLHHPVWVHARNFRPEDHIYEAQLPEPGDKAQLCEFLSELLARPMDRDRPLWDIWVINGLEGGRLAIAFRVHHALADGKTVARLIEAAHTRDTAAAGDDSAVEEPLPGRARLIGDALFDLARSYTTELPHFYHHLKQARNKASSIRERAEHLVAPFSAPFTIFNAPADSSERIYRYESFSLSAFKARAKAYDCTINTLILGVCAEALRRYLKEVDASPSESLVSAMPIGDHGVTKLERLLDSDIQNNNLAVAYLPLYQNIADFDQRLQAIKAASRAAIDHVLHEDGRRFDNYLDFLPGTAIRIVNAAMIRRQKQHKNPYANIIISNVPGPRKTLYALDDRLRMDELLSVGNLMDGGNLNITVWSYVDRLAFSFLFRKDAMPQPERLVAHLKDAVEEILAR